MPANPSITAVMKYGATRSSRQLAPPITAAPVLVWTAPLVAERDRASGQAIDFVLSMRNRASAYASPTTARRGLPKSTLATTTFIHVDSLGVTTLPIWRQPVHHSTQRRTSLCAATASDPFSASYDITSLDVAIDVPAPPAT